MNSIEVQGLGVVDIQGEEPTPEEQAAILKALQNNMTAQQYTVDQLPPDHPARNPFFKRDPERYGYGPDTLGPSQTPMFQMDTGLTPQEFEAVGGTIGSYIGAGATKTPAGAIGGGALGTAGGRSAFDVLNAGYSFAKTGLFPQEKTAFEPAKRALYAGLNDAGWSTALMGSGAFLRMGADKIGQHVLKINPETARVAERTGVPFGPAQASESSVARGYTKVVGVFPFVGSPIKKGQAQIEQKISQEWENTLNQMGPNVALSDIGVDLTRAAERRRKTASKLVGKMYDSFSEKAMSLPEGQKAIFPTGDTAEGVDGLRTIGQKYVDDMASSAIELRKQGEMLQRPVSDEMTDGFMRGLVDLPDHLTMEQLRGLQKDVNRALKKNIANGEDVTNLVSAKRAIEFSLNNADVKNLPPEVADDLVNSLSAANEYYFRMLGSNSLYTRDAANKFRQVNRGIFSGPSKAGTKYEDEMFNVAFRARSPEYIHDLKMVVGPKAFDKGRRGWFEQQITKATRSEGGVETIDFGRLRKNLGLDDASGVKNLEEMLRGSGVTPEKIDDLLTVMEKSDLIPRTDSSTFVQRRAMLGGIGAVTGVFSASAGGGAIAGGSGGGVLTPIIIGRMLSSSLASPKMLKRMTLAFDESKFMIDPQKPLAKNTSMRNNILARLWRESQEEDEDNAN